MDIICAPLGIMSPEYPKKGILTLKNNGFDHILFDMTMNCPREKCSESIETLINLCREHQMCMPVARAPYFVRDTECDNTEEQMARIVEESIKICGQADCGQLIVKPVCEGIPYGMEWEVNRRYYLGLAAVAKEYNVKILLENQCRNFNGHLIRGICSDADEAAVWIDRLNDEVGEERFGFCMDVGICTLCGQRMQEFILTMGSRIKTVILRDGDGQHDISLLSFTYADGGQPATDWLGLIRGLREICFDGELVMDFSSITTMFSHLLRPQLLQMAKAIAEYFKWQIGMKKVMKQYQTRVLFGAGNMCRNYMKCYGEEFPPLFTCDNDRSRWNSQFEGLEIKPPEALKDLSPDCAIFICNIYYKEIEKQLREMGIRNPIAYFNDEYMPSYYADRLAYWTEEEG